MYLWRILHVASVLHSSSESSSLEAFLHEPHKIKSETMTTAHVSLHRVMKNWMMYIHRCTMHFSIFSETHANAMAMSRRWLTKTTTTTAKIEMISLILLPNSEFVKMPKQNVHFIVFRVFHSVSTKLSVRYFLSLHKMCMCVPNVSISF